MTQVTQAPHGNLERIARTLAESHRANDDDMKAVYLAPDPSGQEVRLVEVSSSVGTTGDVFPVRFAARPGLEIPVPCVIVLLSQEEWDDLEKGSLSLPASWGVGWQELRRIA